MEETPMSTASQAINAADSKEKRRLVIIKIFLAMAIINNLYIGISCFALGGGRLLHGAPQWAVFGVGAMAAWTVVGAVLALLWKRIGVMAIVAAGSVATAICLVATLWFQAGLFAVGTVFMVLLARHLWHRFV
jgi:hypothetical protein